MKKGRHRRNCNISFSLSELKDFLSNFARRIGVFNTIEVIVEQRKFIIEIFVNLKIH